MNHDTDQTPFSQTIGMHDSVIGLLTLNFNISIPSTSFTNESSSSQPISLIHDVSPPTSDDSLPNSLIQDNIIEPVFSNSSITNDHSTNLRRSTIVKQVPKYLEVYNSDLFHHITQVTAHLITNYSSNHQSSPAHKVFTTALLKLFEPTSYHEAVKISH